MAHTLIDPVSPSALTDQTIGVRGDHSPLPPGLLPPPPPQGYKMRGIRLVAVWVGLALGAWAVVAALGYGIYALVQALLG